MADDPNTIGRRGRDAMKRAWMEVDLAALLRNASALASRAGVPLIPMVKADAYGLGAISVAHALESLSPFAYGVATVEEGTELRATQIERPIIVFTPLHPLDLNRLPFANLTPTLGSRAEIEAWGIHGLPYILSIDTGMARAGLPWREVESVLDLVERNPPAGAFTHFHSPALEDGSMELQERRFNEAIAKLPARPPVLHTDSSAAIVRHGQSPYDAVRPGIFMYGVGSGPGAAIQPEPVVCVKSRVVELRWVEAGDTVSYDATWTASSRTLVATIPLGYADGYPRGASNRGMGIIRNRPVPIVGRVTMDMIMLDVTETGAETGDPVTMIGNPASSGAPIDIASVAELASMSPYELLTGLKGRLDCIHEGMPQ
jgi:alanine racemase